MEQMLWVTCPFSQEPGRVPLHLLAVILVRSPLPTVQGAASTHVTASPRAWHSQGCCKEHVPLLFSPLLILAPGGWLSF